MTDKIVKQPLVSNRGYDIQKDVVTVWIPALILFYTGLSTFVPVPYPVEVAGVLGLLATFLGTVLKISSVRYANQPQEYDGRLVVNDPDPDREVYRMEIDKDLEELGVKKEITLKVENPSAHGKG